MHNPGSLAIAIRSQYGALAWLSWQDSSRGFGCSSMRVSVCSAAAAC